MDEAIKVFALLGLGFIAGIFITDCNRGRQPELSSKPDTVLYFDTIRDTATVTNTKLKRVVEKQPPDTVQDTAYIFSQFFARREYGACYKDSNLHLNAAIVTEQNELDSFGISYEITRQPLKVELPEYNPNRWRFYAGATISTQTLAPVVTATKQDFYLQGGYDISGGTPLIGGGFRLK